METLSVGATMLLPPLRERMELLHSLLPQGPDRWESLSKGQVQYVASQPELHCLLLLLANLLLLNAGMTMQCTLHESRLQINVCIFS